MTQENRLREAREIINTIDRHTIESQYGFAELEKRLVESLTQAEKRGFERAKSKIAEICLSPALLPNFNCFDGVCVATAIRNLTYEEKV